MVNRATSVNGDVLRWARERAGLSLSAVAARFRKPLDAIAAWEAGEDTPTFGQLEMLAERLYKRPLAIFFFPSPPDEEDPRSQFRTLPESELEALEPETRYRLREALAFQESIREFTGGQNPATTLITRDLQPATGQPVEVLASRARSYLGVSLDTQCSWRDAEHAFKQWRTAVQGAGVFVFKRPFKQADVFGFSIHDDALPLMVINNSTAHSRQVFTIFHELAHLLYSVSGITIQDTSYISRLSGFPRDIEVACNRFAAEFLVPSGSFPWGEFRRAGLDSFVSAQADRYTVSREVILRRLLDRGLVSQATYSAKADEWNRQYRQALRRRSGGDYYTTQATYLGEAFLRLAFTQYYRGAITLEQLADHLHVRARSVSGLEDFVVSGG